MQPIITVQDRHLVNLFGPDDNNEDNATKAAELPTVVQIATVDAPAANYHRLLRDKL